VSVALDASVALAWTYADEQDDAAVSVYQYVRRHGGWVPPIWPLEIANGLQQGVLRKRISLAMRNETLKDMQELLIKIDHESSAFAWTRTLNLADRFHLTPYDASYLELAQRRDLALATLDRNLRGAARKLGLQLLTS
jgi:predicted nucleic acid-binding protein